MKRRPPVLLGTIGTLLTLSGLHMPAVKLGEYTFSYYQAVESPRGFYGTVFLLLMALALGLWGQSWPVCVIGTVVLTNMLPLIPDMIELVGVSKLFQHLGPGAWILIAGPALMASAPVLEQADARLNRKLFRFLRHHNIPL